ncbi:hypothetical protein RB195_019417 [Necator americanus]|uniref:Uncharacterized protein n=2 Tax=Necator americanus TaxID=51031 RepID=A0ABR1CHQ1_NECAM
MKQKNGGHAELNHGPLDLQSNALPLSYTPSSSLSMSTYLSSYSYIEEVIPIAKHYKEMKQKSRGHAELNHGPLDLQSNALPLSYTPSSPLSMSTRLSFLFFGIVVIPTAKHYKEMKQKSRGHAELNHGPLDLQSNALPLSYTPSSPVSMSTRLSFLFFGIVVIPTAKHYKEMKQKSRGHAELNHGPLDLQSNALPLSYTPLVIGVNVNSTVILILRNSSDSHR